MSPKPADFSLEYEWEKGTVPPPYHYEYTIRMGPGSQGEVVFRPDYSRHNPPVWRETFSVSDEMSSELYSLMVEKGVFSTSWRGMDPPPVGGSLERLKVTADGMQFSVPSNIIPEQAKAIRDVYRTIRSMVPETVWAKLMALRKDYEQNYIKKNQLFDFILTLGDQGAFTPEKLSSLTGIPLTETPEKPNKYFSVYYSPENCEKYHPPIRKMELRSPVEKGNPGGLIIIDLCNTSDITGKDVIARFGDVSRLIVPYPEQPRDDPVSYVYEFDWGELRFGISRDESNSLTGVVLDAYESQSFKEYKEQGRRDTAFPLPGDVQNFIKALKSDQINFKTHLSLEEIIHNYRQAFTEQGFTEIKLLTVIAEDCISLVFEGLPEGKVIVLQAVDLGYGSHKDIRHVNIRTEDARQ
jgi:hypothetical protein